MNYKQYFLLTALVSASALVSTSIAGEVTLAPTTSNKGDAFVKLKADTTTRYETRNQQGLDASHAATLRVRPSLSFFDDKPLSLFVESEHTFAGVRDYRVIGNAQAPNFSPFKANNTVISDPENHEFNQFYLNYKKAGYSAKVGRQRIILDNSAFIGNVGWRQNEQTFDAASLTYKNDKFNVFYAYMNRANRIFGVDGSGPVQALEGDVHLLNASTTLGSGKITGYTYLMDFSKTNFGALGASNNTFGFNYAGKSSVVDYYAEFAYQTEAGNKADYDAIYSTIEISKKMSGVKFTAGLNYVEDGFVAPLSTAHKFNGFADVFVANQIGLVNSWEGLTDIYIGAAKKFDSGLVVKAAIHNFKSDDLNTDYGWEADLVIVKPISENMKILSKFAYFMADDFVPFQDDVAQASIQLDFSF